MSQLTKEKSMQLCECCGRGRMCHMYTTQMGTAAWICDDCREGKKS